MEERTEVTEGAEGTVFFGSGNVFADMGLPNPEERLAKAMIASKIHEVMRERKLSQKRAADLMEIDQPKVSKIIRGRLSEFSMEWLLTRLLRLGLDVNIVIRQPASSGPREGVLRVDCA